MTTRTRIFLDCETQGLHSGRRAYEVGVILRDGARPDEELAWFIDIEDLDLANAEPKALEVGRFWQRHPQAHLVPLVGNLAEVTPDLPQTPPTEPVFREAEVLKVVAELTAGRAYIMGSNPAFDTGTLEPRMAVYGIQPGWHYHPIDVPDRAAGWLSGQGREVPTNEKGDEKSDLIAAACGVDPAGYERHTALGDCRLFRDLWDVIQVPPAAAVIGPLTAEEWCSLHLGTDDDPFYCCGDTSDLRDAAFHALRMGGGVEHGVEFHAAWTRVGESHPDHGLVTHPVVAKLYDFYVKDQPVPLTDEEVDELVTDLRMQSARDAVLARVDKFERDLGFTAPELWSDRIADLRAGLTAVFGADAAVREVS